MRFALVLVVLVVLTGCTAAPAPLPTRDPSPEASVVPSPAATIADGTVATGTFESMEFDTDGDVTVTKRGGEFLFAVDGFSTDFFAMA